MIDIWLVASNSLWIAGLSLLLATLSWASWASSVGREDGARFRAILARPGVRRMWGLGLALFCSGMAATGHAWWEWGLWGGLAASFLIFAVLGSRRP
jgi:hypothetical protein